MDDIPPLITLEEHFFTSTIPEPALYSEQFKHLPKVREQLYDLDDVRLSEMDAGAVSLQVISHAPMLAVIGNDACVSANDQLAEAVTRHPDRYAGFAVLPMGDPSASAKELQRCIKELGFVGALVDNHAEGRYFEGPEYDVFWKEAQDLDVPIYLHPTWPTPEMDSHFQSDAFTLGAAKSMGSSGFGWHADVHLHVLRLFAAGTFDKFPKLKIVAGHFGEMLPFMLGRINQLSIRWGQIQRKFDQVYKENIWITTSGVWSVDPMGTILRNTPMEHILYSVDYPFANNRDGFKWVKELKASGLVSEEQLEMICYKNSEALLGVKAPRRGK